MVAQYNECVIFLVEALMCAKKTSWEIESTEEFDDWLSGQEDDDQDHVMAALNVLEREGPALGRPLVDRIRDSKHPNMKELRPGLLRILFAIDPNRRVILLLGGNKSNLWNAWYDKNIPIADALYERHLEKLRRETGLQQKSQGRKGKRR